MAERDEFSKPTKALIAQRAGYICSHPACSYLTIGPSADRKSGVTMTGVAAHIVAAAERGPRADPSLTAEQRSSEANGLWLCAIHGKWIDDNPSQATVAKLQEWKSAHEAEIRAWQEFGHPGIFRSWDRLTALTVDQRGTIETVLPNGYALPRDASDLLNAMDGAAACLVSGESGAGKSALVRAVLDEHFPEARQIWLGPEALQSALSEASREQIGLTAPLADLLPASMAAQNILVVDAVERADSDTIARLARLLRRLADGFLAGGPTWQIIAIGQRAGFEAHLDPLTAFIGNRVVAVTPPEPADVRNALLTVPSLAEHAYDDAFIAMVGNLRTLAWIVSAAPLFASAEAGKMAGRSQIADRLWAHWTGGDPDLHSFMTALARKDAEYERSFALSDLGASERAAWKIGRSRLPIALNDRNRLSFEHDLASDWARYQYLKEIADDVMRWASLARQPLWVAALRLFGQHLLRETDQSARGWDWAYSAAHKATSPDAIDVLLDALCTDPEADKHLNARSDILLADNGKLLDRLLSRFTHIATLPERPAEGTDLGLYVEAEIRRPIWGTWPPLIRFLGKHETAIAALGSASISKLCHLWLTKTPTQIDGYRIMGRSYLARLALGTARTEQIRSIAYGFYGARSDDSDEIFCAGLAGVHELPDEVSAFAREMVRRMPLQEEAQARVDELRAERRRLSKEGRASRRYRASEPPPPPRSFLEPRKLPPWPLGPTGRLHDGFRRAVVRNSALAPFFSSQPAVAAEVLLACIVEDSPIEKRAQFSLDRRLGLEWEHDHRPTIFWNSPFFPFLNASPEFALDALLTLVDFCTERWSAEHGETKTGLTLIGSDGTAKNYAGDWRVLDWSHTRESTNSQLYAALDALERWLWIKISTGVDVEQLCSTLLSRSHSAAILGVLCDCAKLDRRLLETALGPLLSSPELILWDEQRLRYRYGNDIFAWQRAGERLRIIGMEWEQAEHRGNSLRRIILDFRREKAEFDSRAQSAFASWPRASEADNLARRILIAQLDPANWQADSDSDNAATCRFEYPADILTEIQGRERDAPVVPNLASVLGALEQRLGLEFDDKSAAEFFDALDDDEGLNQFLPSDRRAIVTAIASALVVRARPWLTNNPLEADRVTGLLERVLSEGGDVTPWFPPAGIRAQQLCCA